MIELRGKYNNAKVFTDNVDGETIGQIISLLNQPLVPLYNHNLKNHNLHLI